MTFLGFRHFARKSTLFLVNSAFKFYLDFSRNNFTLKIVLDIPRNYF